MRCAIPTSILAALVNLVVSSADLQAAEPAVKVKDPIQDAVKKGADYLVEVHRPAQGYSGGSNNIGTACLAGLALLESGIDEKNPSMANIIKCVREGCLQETSTYHLSLCIMFLDRLGHPADEPMIQFMGVRLMNGQTPSGGWSYSCNGYLLSPQEEARLRNAFAKDAKLTSAPKLPQGEPAKPDTARDDLPADPNKPVPPKETPKNPSPKEKPAKEEPKKAERGTLHPEVGKLLNQMQNQEPAPGRKGPLGPRFPLGFMGEGDNSNTQFAILGLWCARKHGLGVEKAMLGIEKRFRDTQAPDGGWGYVGRGGSTAPMTCAGLIGLAVSFGSHESVLKSKRDVQAPAKRKDGRVDLGEDEAVKAGLKRLGQYISDAQGGGKAMPPKGPKGRRRFGLDELNSNLYFLWSLERVGVIFGLETIGNNDWYSWGSDALVDSQLADGTWRSLFPGATADVTTPLALLFLNRANVAKDLTETLHGKVKDPGIAVLKSGGDLSKILPGLKKEPAKNADVAATKPPAPMVESPISAPMTNTSADFESEARRLTEGVVNAAGERRSELILTLRDSKGAVYTEALSRLAAKLTGASQAEVREALAGRLTRMKAGTLREMLGDESREIRRASAVACGLKEDKQLIPDLISALTDKDSGVIRAAQSSLKALTGKDFGPENLTDADKTRTVLAWKAWLKTQPE